MPEDRFIPGGLVEDERFLGLSVTARLVLIMAHTTTCDEGRMPASPLAVKRAAGLFGAAEVSEQAILAALEELDGSGLVRLFHADGRPFLFVPEHFETQKTKKYFRPSSHPLPPFELLQQHPNYLRGLALLTTKSERRRSLRTGEARRHPELAVLILESGGNPVGGQGEPGGSETGARGDDAVAVAVAVAVAEEEPSQARALEGPPPPRGRARARPTPASRDQSAGGTAATGEEPEALEVEAVPPDAAEPGASEAWPQGGKLEPGEVGEGPGPAHEAARLLADCVRREDPQAAIPPTPEPWAIELQRLHSADGRPWSEIGDAIRWIFAADCDGFWRANVRSAVDLRRHFPKIRGQMRRSQARSGPEPIAAKRARVFGIHEVADGLRTSAGGGAP